MPEIHTFHTSRLLLRILDESAAPAVLDYYQRNREFHQPWFAARPDLIFTVQQQQANLAAEYADFQAGRCLPFWLSLQSDPEKIIGRIAATQIVRGCFNSSFIAWHLDEHCQGDGLAFEAAQAAIGLLFKDFKLHRLEANIMPANNRSIALAERLGFRLEGRAQRYLKINGAWEDHLHFVRMADDPADDPDSPTLETGFLQIRLLQLSDIPAAMAYYARNLVHLYTWNPAPDVNLASEAGWRQLITAAKLCNGTGRRLDFGVFLADRPDRMVGTVECRSILPLPFSSCEVGFSIDQLLSGRGLMPDILSQVISWLFARFGLKRITANCCTEHDRSIRLLSLLGFHQEGQARQAIYLRDSWHDLTRLALLQDDFHPIVTMNHPS